MPECLVPGDRIGIVAPSSAFDDQMFWRGIETIRDMGFFPVIPDQLFLKKRYLAGEDHHRAHLINRMFADDAIKAIFCARGGYGASRVLSHLDWKTICSHPKVFVGFSDVSVLLTAFYSRCGMVTFHGPVVTSLAVSDPETKAMLKAVISTPDPVVYDLGRPVAIRPGTARGTVMGGNLCTLCHLAGTAFAPDVSGSILFLEDCGEPSYKIDRMLNHLKMCGWLEDIAGLMIGSFERCGDEEVIFQIVEEMFEDDRIPVMGGLEIGHGVRNLTIPVGVEAVLDTSRGQLAFCRPATSPACVADRI